MKIVRIELNNFRGLDNLNLSFLDDTQGVLDTIVLAGPNGCGKTSAMEACVIALGKQDLIYTTRQPEDDVRLGADTYRIAVTVDIHGAKQEVIVTSRDSKRSRMLGGMSDLQRASEEQVEYFSSWRGPKLVGSIPITAGKRGKRPQPSEENRLWIVKQFLVNATAREAFAKVTETIFSESIVGREALEKINQGWRLFYPETEARFEARPAMRVDEGFDVYLVSPKSSRAIPVDCLSSGEIEVFVMLGWFALNSGQQGVLFIDEPELHLHPSWHRIILPALRKVLPKAQIIASTHSVEILESVPSNQRFTLLPDDDPRMQDFRRSAGEAGK